MTFLFTDIEGSTQLWEQHAAPMQTALARHDEILREAIESSGGEVLKHKVVELVRDTAAELLGDDPERVVPS